MELGRSMQFIDEQRSIEMNQKKEYAHLLVNIFYFVHANFFSTVYLFRWGRDTDSREQDGKNRLDVGAVSL